MTRTFTLWRASLAIILASIASNLCAQWNQIGSPKGAHVKVMAFRGDTIFAGGSHKIYDIWHTPDAYSIYRSFDNGNTWQKAYSSDDEITALAFKGDKIFAATAAGMLRSDDFGKTWLQLNLKGQIESVSIFNDAVFAGTSDGNIFKTTDDGINWKKVYDSPNYARIVTIVANDGKLIAGSSTYSFVDFYESDDNGETWSESIGSINESMRGMLVRGSTFFAIMYGSIYTSSDQGRSWNKIDLDFNAFYTTIALDENKVLYAGTERQGVYQSSDNGVTWVSANDGLKHYQAHIFSNQQGELFVGNLAGVYRSDNTTIRWEHKNEGFPTYVANNILQVEDKLYATTYGGVWTSADNGQSWQHDSRNSNSTKNTALAYWSDTLYMGAENNLLQRSEASDEDWISTNIGDRVISLIPGDSVSYLLTNNKVYRRFNNQSEWKLANIGLPSGDLVELIKSGSNLIVNSGQNLYRSTDGGDSWSKVEGAISGSITIFDIEATEKYLYIVRRIPASGVNRREVFRSEDQGSTWESVGELAWGNAVISSNEWDDIIAANDSLVFIAGGKERIFVSPHENIQWREINDGFPEGDIASLTTLEDGLLATLYSGENWTYSLEKGITFPKAPSGLAGKYTYYPHVQLSWEDNSENETGFIIYRSEPEYVNVLHPVDTVDANVTTYLDEDFIYYNSDDISFYRVVATINGKNSEVSNTAVVVRRSESAPSVDYITDSSFVLWRYNYNGVDSVALDISTDRFETFLPEYDGNLIVSDSIIINNLTPGLNYYVRVRPYVSGYYGSYSDTVVVQLTPTAPANFIVKDIGAEEVYFEWEDRSSNEDGFVVQRREIIDEYETSFYDLASVGKDTTLYILTNASDFLYNNQRYEFRVRAFNNGGESYSEVFRVDSPEAPTDFTVLNAGRDKFYFEWTDNSNNEAAFIIEYRYPGSDYYEKFGEVGADTVSVVITSSSFYNKYITFRVVAFNRGGRAESNESSIVTGIEEENRLEPLSLKVFPNPTKDFVTIRGRNIQSVNVANLIGNQVLIPQKLVSNGIRLDFSKQPIGIYLVEIVAYNQKVIKKIIRK